MKSLLFRLLLLAKLFTLSSSACMDNDGVPLPSIVDIPVFEDSALAIETSLNATISAANTALAEVLSLSSTWTIQQERAGFPLTFDNTLGALDKLLNDYWRPGYRFYFLSRVSDDEEVRNAGQAASLEMRTWARENVDYNMDLYQLLGEYNETENALQLTDERRLLLDDTLEAFQRRGMALGEEDRAQLQAWQEELSEITTNISTTITLATGAVEFTPEELMGLSDQHLASLLYNSTTDTYTAMTAIASQYRTVMTYANNSETRLKTGIARMQRAMDENGEDILSVLHLRQQIASLLGFQHWADYKTVDKMAKTGAIAFDFITNIDERLNDQFGKEQEMLLGLKKEHLDDPDVNVLDRHDVSFYKNILLERDYQINQDEISEYFPEDATLKGIFDLYEELFDIRIVYDPNDGVPAEGDDGAALWAEDVQFIYIYDKNGTEPLGGVYLDLHPRDGKFKHFAKFSIIQGHHRTTSEGDGGLAYQAPICAIVGNWPVAVGNVSVPLWRFSNVNTMLHEFGHALHTVLTCAEFSSYAGTSVPRDFVEVPSQMLERWLDDINVVRRFAKHYETGETMPERLLQSLIDARMVTIGHGYKGQVSYGLSDLLIHTYKTPEDIPSTPAEVYEATNEEYAKYYPVPENTAMLAAFGHLFGGYDAGYYGYAWADAIAADLASSFRDSPKGFMDSQLGDRFRREILEPGGSRDPNESIRAFLGRDWNTDAFFAEMGLSTTTAAAVVDDGMVEQENNTEQETNTGVGNVEPEVGGGGEQVSIIGGGNELETDGDGDGDGDGTEEENNVNPNTIDEERGGVSGSPEHDSDSTSTSSGGQETTSSNGPQDLGSTNVGNEPDNTDDAMISAAFATGQSWYGATMIIGGIALIQAF